MSHRTQDQALLAACPCTCTLGLGPSPPTLHPIVTWDACRSAKHARMIAFRWLSDLAVGTGGDDWSEDGTTVAEGGCICGVSL